MNPTLPLAIAAGKLTKIATKNLNLGGGTAAPGLVAETIDPGILSDLAQNLPQGVVLISGTNGKTTTSRLLGEILKTSDLRIVHNRSGSNLTRGLASTLLDKANVSGEIEADLGLFEVDEAALTRAAEELNPKVLILLNLFRDQLDRYFELDKLLLRWRKLVESLPKETMLVLNADDPRVASLGQSAQGPVIYFGVAESVHKLANLPQAADTRGCPDCGAQITYEEIYLGHQGKYACSNCTLKRPELDVSASNIELAGTEGTTFSLATPKGHTTITLKLPGFYNLYNALAAAAGAVAQDLSLDTIQKGLQTGSPAFGRIERVSAGDKKILITLVKNPTGFNEVLRMLEGAQDEHLLLALNDLLADGTDVSWIWDVDLEKIAGWKGLITVSGTRAWDLATRLKYAGIYPNLLQVEPDLEKALDQALERTSPGQTLYILPTYTAMLSLRKILTKRGHVQAFWED
jgi:UDP-N-acetylmuramyl tripeptide synthase